MRQTSDESWFAGDSRLSANGRPYLKQIETESGIWFRDVRRSANHRRALVDWPTPDGLAGRLQIDQDAADAALKTEPFDFGLPRQIPVEVLIISLATARAMRSNTEKSRMVTCPIHGSNIQI